MKPVLTVEGKQYNNIDLQYRNGKLTCIAVWDEDNKLLPYYNANIENHAYVEKSLLLDFDKALKWEGQHEEIIVALEKRIEAHEERLNELSYEFMLLAISKDVVFPEIEGKSLKEEFNMLHLQVEGLIEAKRIIMIERESVGNQLVEGVQKAVTFYVGKGD